MLNARVNATVTLGGVTLHTSTVVAAGVNVAVTEVVVSANVELAVTLNLDLSSYDESPCVAPSFPPRCIEASVFIRRPVFVCVCVCVRARARVCVYVRA